MARPGSFAGTRPTSVGLTGDNAFLFDDYVNEGLLSPCFIPSGEMEHEIRSSIEARAYTNWLALVFFGRDSSPMDAIPTRQRINTLAVRLGLSESQVAKERYIEGAETLLPEELRVLFMRRNKRAQ